NPKGALVPGQGGPFVLVVKGRRPDTEVNFCNDLFKAFGPSPARALGAPEQVPPCCVLVASKGKAPSRAPLGLASSAPLSCGLAAPERLEETSISLASTRRIPSRSPSTVNECETNCTRTCRPRISSVFALPSNSYHLTIATPGVMWAWPCTTRVV